MFDRYLKTKIDKYLKASKSILLLGPRQTGKSTLIEEYLKNTKKKSLVYKLQDINVYEEIILDPGLISRQVETELKKGPLILFIDEVQKIPKLMDGCQYLIDKYKEQISVILSGSSARKLRGKNVNLIPGRLFVENMHSLMIPEIMKIKEQEILPLKIDTGEKINPSIEDLLIYGMLPKVLKEKDFKRELLKSYTSTYLEEEIRMEALSRNLGLFSKFMTLSAHESGSAPNLSNLSAETGISLNTIKNYFDILEDTLITFSIPAFQKENRKQILTTPRYIYFDVGIRNAVTKSFIDKSTLQSEIGGQLFEQFIILELIKRIKYAYPYYSYSFYRTKSGMEIDFIIDTGEEIIPIEIKYTKIPQQKHIKHLKVFMELFKKKVKRAYLIGNFTTTTILENNIYAVPWHAI